MPKILFFSKFLAYNMGGAEKSMLHLAKEMSDLGNEIIFVSLCMQDDRHSVPLLELLPNWKVIYINGCTLLGKFPYLEYLINRRIVRKFFENITADELHTYGVWAPAAEMGFSGNTFYYLRSFSDLGCQVNNFKGLKRIFKYAYIAFEWMPFLLFRADLKHMLARVNIVANSQYMARKLMAMYNRRATVLYPIVNIDFLRQRLKSRADRTWIVFVGDNVGKGLDVVLKLSKALPLYRFRIHSRNVKSIIQDSNVLWVPWTNDESSVYVDAMLVIVPSQWEEAYGRVAREAFLLKIPVLVSDVGGLPEAVDNNAALIVKDYKSVSGWIAAITDMIKSQYADTQKYT